MLTALHLFRRAALILGLAALFALVACSSDNGSTPSTTTASGVTISISGNKFDVPATVAPGATITVRNDDKVEHSVTSDTAGLFDAEADGGETTTFTAPTAPGSYPIHCRYHPSMHATLTVA